MSTREGQASFAFEGEAVALPESGPYLGRGAVVSPCGTYRYQLSREWNRSRGVVNFVMLNPSTADANEDDPTIRRCVGFAKAWGFGSLVVTNLYALRSTDPRAIRAHAAPIGPENDYVLEVTALEARAVIFAWGVHGGGRGHAVAAMLRNRSPMCLGLTKDGSPKHPLYLPASVRPTSFFPTPANEDAPSPDTEEPPA